MIPYTSRLFIRPVDLYRLQPAGVLKCVSSLLYANVSGDVVCSIKKSCLLSGNLLMFRPLIVSGLQIH